MPKKRGPPPFQVGSPYDGVSTRQSIGNEMMFTPSDNQTLKANSLNSKSMTQDIYQKIIDSVINLQDPQQALMDKVRFDRVANE